LTYGRGVVDDEGTVCVGFVKSNFEEP